MTRSFATGAANVPHGEERDAGRLAAAALPAIEAQAPEDKRKAT